MKKIVVTYWNNNELIPYFENNTLFEYSVKKQNEIIQKIIDEGFSVMLRPNMGVDSDILLIYISNGRFEES